MSGPGKVHFLRPGFTVNGRTMPARTCGRDPELANRITDVFERLGVARRSQTRLMGYIHSAFLDSSRPTAGRGAVETGPMLLAELLWRFRL